MAIIGGGRRGGGEGGGIMAEEYGGHHNHRDSHTRKKQISFSLHLPEIYLVYITKPSLKW